MADLTFQLLEKCQEKQERIASSLKLTVAEFKLLLAFHADALLTAGELAKRMGLSNSRLTRILDGLVHKGVVSRALGVRDRRVMEISLTDRGKKVQEKQSSRSTSTDHLVHGRATATMSPPRIGS